MIENSVTIVGRLKTRVDKRYTPAGVEVFDAQFEHSSKVVEAGHTRDLKFEFQAIAFGALATKLNEEPLGCEIIINGFVAPVSMRNTRLLIHITDFSLRS